MPFVIETTAHGPVKRTLRELMRYLHDSAPPDWVEKYAACRKLGMTQEEAWKWVRMKAVGGGS